MKNKITEYMKSSNLSQSATARMLGISESTFSRYLTGTYPNPESIERKITELLEKEQVRREVTGMRDISFALTSISGTVMNVLEYARIQRTIAVIYGDAGIGKTRTAREWAKEKSDVVYLTATPAFNSPKSFLKYLARELRSIKMGHIDELYMEILDRLQGSDKVLIIDEAQHLTMKTLENVRSIQDVTGVAVVLIGNEMIYTKMVGRQQAEFAQLFSRIGIRKHVMTDQFVADDVRKVFGELQDEVIHVLLEICRSKYGLRGAIHVFVNASNNADVSVKGIRAMAKTMGIVI